MAGGSRVPGPKVSGPKERPSFVMGSRPANMRAPIPGGNPVGRIKPLAGQTQYGKQAPGAGAGMQAGIAAPSLYGGLPGV